MLLKLAATVFVVLQMLDTATEGSVAAVSSKLQQVQGYIHQTTVAMQALEQQADTVILVCFTNCFVFSIKGLSTILASISISI